VLKAADTLLAAYSRDFTWAGARNVDLLGSVRHPAGVRAGYQTIDRTMYRVLDITIPIVVNDAWDQVP
jgi:hypothetical protein